MSLNPKEEAKFKKVCYAHGFSLVKAEYDKPSQFSSGSISDDFLFEKIAGTWENIDHYTKKKTSGGDRRHTVWVTLYTPNSGRRGDSDKHWVFKYTQDNGLYVPYGSGDNANQLDRVLTRDINEATRYPTDKKPGDPTYSAQWSGVTGAPKAKGKACPRCGGAVHQEGVGGESYYCPRCDDYVSPIIKEARAYNIHTRRGPHTAPTTRGGSSEDTTMQYKCVDCQNVFTSNDPEKSGCPKCGSKKWGKVDDKGDWTPQNEAVDIIVSLRGKNYQGAQEAFTALMQTKVNKVLMEERRHLLETETEGPNGTNPKTHKFVPGSTGWGDLETRENPPKYCKQCGAREDEHTIKEEITKRAVIRDTDTPVGQPGKMHLDCGCGNTVEMPGYPETGATCTKCGQKYDGKGYLKEDEGKLSPSNFSRSRPVGAAQHICQYPGNTKPCPACPKSMGGTLPDKLKEGFYVMGQHTSVGWYKTKEEADADAKRMNYRGGTNYTVVPDTTPTKGGRVSPMDEASGADTDGTDDELDRQQSNSHAYEYDTPDERKERDNARRRPFVAKYGQTGGSMASRDAFAKGAADRKVADAAYFKTRPKADMSRLGEAAAWPDPPEDQTYANAPRPTPKEPSPLFKAQKARAQARVGKSARERAYNDLGMTKVKGNLGGTYYEGVTYEMCPDCEKSFSSTQLVNGKLPPHRFNGKPCAGQLAEATGNGERGLQFAQNMINDLPYTHNLRVRANHQSIDCDTCEEGISADESQEEIGSFIRSHQDCDKNFNDPKEVAEEKAWIVRITNPTVLEETVNEDLAKDDDFYTCKGCGTESTSQYCQACKDAGKEPDVPHSIKEGREGTLDQWAEKQPYRLGSKGASKFMPDGGFNLVDRAAAWNLDDYFVSSVSGGTIWFTSRDDAAPGTFQSK